jgi:Arc/MetJ-type ribon-helix-helix transcriptional regulator
MPTISVTKELTNVIKRIRSRGRYASTTEIVRAGLRLLEKQELNGYLNPTPLPPGSLEKIYAQETAEERNTVRRATAASKRAAKKPLSRGFDRL